MKLYTQLFLRRVSTIFAILLLIVQQVRCEKTPLILKDHNLGMELSHGLGKRLLCATVVEFIAQLNSLSQVLRFKLRVNHCWQSSEQTKASC